ncbi:MAG: DUF853 family protein [Candidatus Aenigmarchaeota archaeon]|nr:DUF853 family protein [Candidatus Aenigmarchaeota archaeon]
MPYIEFNASTTSAGNHSQNWIEVNTTAIDTNLGTITIRLYNTTGLVSSSTNTSLPAFKNFTSLADGTYYINATANDSAGNSNNTATRAITLDTTKPALILSRPSNNSYLNYSANIGLNYSASDSYLSAVWYNLDNGTNSTLTGNTTFNTTEGQHTLYIYANDSAGNLNSTQAAFTSDTTNPYIEYNTSTEGSGSVINRSNIIVNISASDTNLANVTIYLYNSSRILVNSNTSLSGGIMNFTGLSDGLYYFNATAYDYAANSNNTAIRNVTIDTLFPNITINSPVAVVYKQQNQNISINYTYNETNPANITIYLFNQTGAINSTLVIGLSSGVITRIDNITTPSNSVDGNYTLNITIIDLAGHTTSSQTNNTVVIDSTLPLISFAVPTEENNIYISNRSWIAINVSVTETNEQNITFRLYNNITGITNTSIYTNTTRFVNYTNLSDGYYYYNVTVYDKAANANTTETRIITLDSSAPTIYNKTKNNARQYGNVTLSLNVSDIGNINITVRIAYPDSTIVNHSMNGNTGLINLTLANLSILGDYYVNYTISDSAGNSAGTNDSFEIYQPQNITTNFTNADGNTVNVSLRFLLPGTNTTAYNSSSSSLNLTNDEIHARLYDIIINVFNDSITFYSVNMTNISYLFSFDIPGVSTFSTTNYKSIKILAVNTSLSANANMTLNYTNLYSAETSAVNESGLTVHKCSPWNFLSRSCSASWTQVSNITINTTTKLILFNVSNFSAYAVTENTCGNSICQAGYGETSSNCPADCTAITTCGNSVCESGETCSSCQADCGSCSSGGGGGGGGATVVQQTDKKKETDVSIAPYRVDINNIKKKLLIGQLETETIAITNNKKTPIKMNISVEGSAKDLIIIPSKNITIGASSVEHLQITLLSGSDEGMFEGNIILTSDNITQTVPVTMEIVKDFVKLLDISVETDKKTLGQNESIRFKVIMYNMGTSQRYDIFLQYRIIELENKTLVESKNETVAIETSLSIIREFLPIKDIRTGDYAIEVIALYDNLSATATSTFYIVEDRQPAGMFFFIPEEIKRDLPVLMSFVIITIVVIGGLYAFIVLRRKKEQKDIEEKKKKSIYVWPDFNLIPKTGAWLGLIADSDKKAHINTNNLNVHTLIAGGTGCGKTVSSMVIAEEALEKKIPVIVFDPVGQWTGLVKPCADPRMKQSYKAFRISKTKAHGFKGEIFEIITPETQPDIKYYMKQPLTIFAMNKMSPKKIDEFMTNVLDQIFKADLPETSGLKLLIIIDEVHRLLPKYGGKHGYVKLEQAVREFRKWGIGLLLISQVLTDFKGAIRGNIATEVQMRTKYEGDVSRVRAKYGTSFSRLVSKLPVGTGMMQNSAYNKGNPYYVQFRPIYHSPFKLTDAEISRYRKAKIKTFETGEKKHEKNGTEKQKVAHSTAVDKAKTLSAKTSHHIERIKKTLHHAYFEPTKDKQKTRTK